MTGRRTASVSFSFRSLIAVLGATAALLPGGAALAAGTEDGYAFAADARPAEAAAGTADAARLEPGTPYTSTLPRGGTVYFRLDLDAASNTYVSVTAVPGTGGEVSAADGVRVSVRDADGRPCSLDSATFGAARSPRPLTAWGMRETSPDETRCQDAGSYYVAVERVRPQDSPPGDWDLEIVAAIEPRLRGDGAPTAPGTWNSASPEPVAGEPERRPGGRGFADAAPLGHGVWRDDIRPGQTLYYRVPVDWGQQVHATAELSGSGEGRGYAPAALDLALHNPVRGRVDDAGAGYTGRRTTVALDPVPPVEYGNRRAVAQRVSAMRFAGAHYLVVHLAAQVADGFGTGPLALTLRVRIGGAAGTGPGYAGEPVPNGVFEVTERDRERAAPGAAADDDLAMKALAAGGIGTGSLLLVGLGVWTAVAQIRARAQKPTA
ncbi:hypothetical protein ACLGIH_16640 [Streptomyces sp. HMX87]|uniref:hypothetical protein n=1 Tax=Streptomyces sp. HMX87 TaxID=3390849 RepID=UPI003A89E484